jgi:predicted dehydrogenase
VGIVGCGAATQTAHIPSLLKIGNVEIVACDKDEELAKRVAERFHINKYYADFPQMLNRERLDIIDICTPPNTHATLSIQAMEAGCHVLVEKPMASSVKEADEMVSASKRNRVKLCVVHNNLFDPMVMRAKSIISQGGIGDLTANRYRVLDTKRYTLAGKQGSLVS